MELTGKVIIFESENNAGLWYKAIQDVIYDRKVNSTFLDMKDDINTWEMANTPSKKGEGKVEKTKDFES